MRFQVKGLHPVRGVISLSLHAQSMEDASTQASNQGVKVVSIQRDWMDSFRREPRRSFNLLVFTQELKALLSAGLSIIEALGAIARKEETPYKRTVVERLIEQLREGKPLSQALRAIPQEFPPLYIALTSASERTGDLGTALSRFIAYRLQMDAVKKKVVASAIYPILLLGVGGLVILFLMSYVVPRFSRIYEDFGRDLPFMSKVLMQWGTLVSNHGLAMLFMVLAVSVLIGVSIRNEANWPNLVQRLLVHDALRQRLRYYEVSRFYRTLGLLQQGGIPIVPALTMASQLLSKDLSSALAHGINQIQAGSAFSDAMERQGLAPSVALDLLRVGEKTGNLGEQMIRIADFYDEDLSRWIEWFTRLFEPILMLLIGLFIAFVVVLLYLPIFELAGNLQ